MTDTIVEVIENPVTVEVLETPTIVEVVVGQALVVQGGGGGVRYTHTQASASSSWTVNHNLGLRPQVEVFSPGGVSVEAAVQHTSDNQTLITFNSPQTGTAVFN